ncbi:alpha/beta fold hydrolase [Blastococcus xanthinilyticus]|uniref:Pimeloyl-ACP methyl ester carboxylesterase n=1 Tax=Blastococcus xanthinilyticus TaxID=1564164 RepID=A0A5S5CXJ3_9ACTN|nr:alpha/beta hydrolase [Blastococcus xanthinilyticus]TYP88521.1 pimeloyl-ACP methyl ester carboxylesterase [Blastococcus xanthinilyticus]
MPTFPAADGAVLHHDRLGGDGGNPLVVIAGGAALHPAYLGDLAGLSGVRPLVVPHLRGVGESPRPADPERGSYWRQAEDVEALREHLGLARLAVAGHSAGTRLALAWAARFPDRVDRLLLITPPAQVVPEAAADADALESRRGDPVGDAALAARERGPDLTDDDSFNAYFAAVAPLSYSAWTDREQAHAAGMRFDMVAMQAYFSVPPPEDLAQRCAAVPAPVLVVAGAEDAPVGPTPPRVVAGLFPRGELVVLDGCGHFPWVERPEAFRAAVDGFVAG